VLEGGCACLGRWFRGCVWLVCAGGCGRVFFLVIVAETQGAFLDSLAFLLLEDRVTELGPLVLLESLANQPAVYSTYRVLALGSGVPVSESMASARRLRKSSRWTKPTV